MKKIRYVTRHRFQCECKSTDLVLVQEDVTVTTPVNLDDDGEISFDNTKVDPGQNNKVYKCANCRKTIASSKEDLLLKTEQEFLQAQPDFIDGIKAIFAKDEAEPGDHDTMLTTYLLNRGIEVEPKPQEEEEKITIDPG